MNILNCTVTVYLVSNVERMQAFKHVEMHAMAFLTVHLSDTLNNCIEKARQID